MEVLRISQLQDALSFNRNKVILFAACTLALGYFLVRKLFQKRKTMDLRGMVCLITGASSGIGEALAHEFVKNGCKVILTARRIDRLNAVKKTIINDYKVPESDVQVLYMDVGDHDTVDRVIKELIAERPIDILVNNAGYGLVDVIDKSSMSGFKQIFDVNFFGAIATTKAVLPQMRERRTGSVIFISSLAGKLATPIHASYSASKHAMQAFADCLRGENADIDLNVLLVSPGYINTDIYRGLLRGDGQTKYISEETIENIRNGIPAEICAQEIVTALQTYRLDILVTKQRAFFHFVIALRYIFPDTVLEHIKKQGLEARQKLYGDSK